MLKNNEEVIIGWQGNGVAPKRSQGTSDDCTENGFISYPELKETKFSVHESPTWVLAGMSLHATNA